MEHISTQVFSNMHKMFSPIMTKLVHAYIQDMFLCPMKPFEDMIEYQLSILLLVCVL